MLDKFIAYRFVKEEKLVFSIQTRNGKGHNDFDEPTLYYSKPEGALQYIKPTVILTNHSTVSAGEEFLLFLETQSHITIVGDTTAMTTQLCNASTSVFSKSAYSDASDPLLPILTDPPIPEGLTPQI